MKWKNQLFHNVLSYYAHRVGLLTEETSTLLAPVGSTVYRVQTRYYIVFQTMKTEFFFFTNPKDFYVVYLLWDRQSYALIYVPQTHRILLYLGIIGEISVGGFRFGCTVTYNIWLTRCKITCNIWLAPLLLFFRSHGNTRVRMFLSVLQSKYIRQFYNQVEVTTVQILFKFYMELDGFSSTSFQVFDYAEIKGKSQTNLKPFYFA